LEFRIFCAGFVLAYRQLLPQSQQDTLLQQFPGHSTILSLSPFFKAQASVRCLAALQLTFEHNRGLCWLPLLTCPESSQREKAQLPELPNPKLKHCLVMPTCAGTALVNTIPATGQDTQRQRQGSQQAAGKAAGHYHPARRKLQASSDSSAQRARWSHGPGCWLT
jgi:hypothetical protein